MLKYSQVNANGKLIPWLTAAFALVVTSKQAGNCKASGRTPSPPECVASVGVGCRLISIVHRTASARATSGRGGTLYGGFHQQGPCMNSPKCFLSSIFNRTTRIFAWTSIREFISRFEGYHMANLYPSLVLEERSTVQFSFLRTMSEALVLRSQNPFFATFAVILGADV